MTTNQKVGSSNLSGHAIMPKWRNRQTHAPQKRAGNPHAGSSPAFGTIYRICNGAIAQLVERLNRTQEVSGSIPLSSTIFLDSSTVEHPAVNRRVVGSNPTRGATIYGPMVKRLRHCPFTAESGVRIPLGSPVLFLLNYPYGRLAQGESTRFTREGSAVRSCHCPLSIS